MNTMFSLLINVHNQVHTGEMIKNILNFADK